MVVTIPLPGAARHRRRFRAGDQRTAIAAVDYVPAGKVAFQAERRFWEQDHAIYGGISWTSRDITQIWYPTAGIHQKKGILVGAYIWSDDIGRTFAAMPVAQRLEHALRMARQLHPEYRQYLTKGVAVAWPNIPLQRRRPGRNGAREARTHALSAAAEGRRPVPVLPASTCPTSPAGRKGGALSAHYTLRDIADRMRG